jgi:hypothetical protein
MRYRLLFLLTAVSVLAAVDDPVATPPVVIRSDPISGAQQVDPHRTHIEITFQQPLAADEWAVAGTPFGATPQTTGKPQLSPDGRSVVVPVRLQPDTRYVIAVNHAGDDQFRSRSGIAALPWLLAFSTGSATGSATGDDHLQAAGAVATAVLAELRAGDIEAVRRRFDPAMREAVSRQALAEVWRQTTHGVGPWIGSSTISSGWHGGYRVVELGLRWENARWRMQISFDADDRIAGLYITPPE